VIELGIVLAVLIGWQLTASELLGGLLMIVLFVITARATLPTSRSKRLAIDSDGGRGFRSEPCGTAARLTLAGKAARGGPLEGGSGLRVRRPSGCCARRSLAASWWRGSSPHWCWPGPGRTCS
jgi:hypothetical protein